MKIVDEGFFLYSKKFGEKSKIIYIFSKENGLIKGLTRNSRSNNINFINLDRILFTWSSRNVNALGYLKCEQKYSKYLDDYLFSIIKAAASELCLRFLPQWEKNLHIFNDLENLISQKKKNNYFLIGKYIDWEINLLKNLGYRLNIDYCSISGKKNETYFLSPKTGNAVSYEVGKRYSHKLFKIPLCMKEGFKKDYYNDYMDAMKINLFFFQKILEKKNINLIFRNQIIKFFHNL